MDEFGGGEDECRAVTVQTKTASGVEIIGQKHEATACICHGDLCNPAVAISGGFVWILGALLLSLL